ncbi:MAG: ParA family protein [Proteobacteria bacterium]|nr:ParA family protein [Pseudomonadota bacterium]MCP4917763.1 ParA family protein [Pseudomonadota bacterium]
MRNLLKTGFRRIVGGAPSSPTPQRARGTKNATVIAVAAQKGGVGKTTTSVNVAAALARFHGQRVLLVDLDPQGHVNTALSEQIRVGGGALSDVLVGDEGLEVLDVVTPTHVENLDVTPFDAQLGTTENLLSTRIGKEFVLRDALEVTRTFYDVIVIDCPPNLGNLTLNGLVAADQVLIPCDPSPLAVSGVHSLVDAIRGVARLNPNIDVLGVLMTRVDGRNTTLNSAITAELATDFGDAVLPVTIGINSQIAKAQHAGVDIFGYAAASRGAQNYRALAEHIVTALAPTS